MTFLRNNLKNIYQNARSGWIWSALEQFGQKGLLLIVGMIQARLMEPSDFGLVASTSIFVMTAQCLIDGGITQRIIQKPRVQEKDLVSLFWSNLCAALLMSSFLVLASGAISGYLRQPELKTIIRVVALVLLLMSAGRVQNTVLMRDLRFKPIAIITLCSYSIGCLTGLTLALSGFGVWALVFQQVATFGVRALLYWTVFPWIPRGTASWGTVRELYRFGAPILGSQFIQVVAGQISNVFIARNFTASALGFFDRGRLIPMSASGALGTVFNQVNFPVLARIQDDEDGYLRGYGHFLRMAAYICFPVMGAAMVLASPIIVFVLGGKWIPAVPYFQLSCLICCLYVIYTVNLDVLRSRGHADGYFRYNTLSACLQVAGLMVGLRWGITGMLWGDIAGRMLGLIFLMLGIHVKTCVKITWQLKQLVMPVLLTAVLCALLLLIQKNT